MHIAFIGLGVMGRPMAANLNAARHTLIVPDRPSLTGEIRAIATVACNAGVAVADAECVLLMLPDTPDVEAVLFGPGGVVESLRPGTLVLDMSSISPAATRGFAARIMAAGCDWVDAPVSGGEVGAKAASLTIMAGGSEPAFKRALPLLEVLGKVITHVGAAGAGQTCKVANQMIVAANIMAVAEALTFARKSGTDPERVRQALLGGFANSRVLEVHGKRMTGRAFEPGFRIRLHQKDLSLALSAARELALSLPGVALAQQLFSSCVAHGDADSDHSAMVTALERLAAVD